MLKIDPEATLDELVAAEPRLLTVLHRCGLDTCCGGALPLREAARRHELSLDAFLAELGAAAERA
jgi:iron-sulfur cluster repair protein YtfE (RIC family)